jgi:hypothetical protein
MRQFLVLAALCAGVPGSLLADEAPLRVAPFKVDATPAVGTPVAYAKARSIEDPLSARGVVLLGAGKPVVLCAVDWIGIGNAGHDEWRAGLARAAGTTPDRVTVHTLHQHDGPRCDFSTESLLAAHGLGGTSFDNDFGRKTIASCAAAVRDAASNARPVTHLGVGEAHVEKVASSRRILGPDGKVAIVRYSASKDPRAQEAPEGTIDPVLKLLSFWDGDKPIAALTYYATHPQSYYGKGDVTAEFVGLARGLREFDTRLPHVHFNGASGNVAAGKYNDGSPEARRVLTQRMEAGMKKAWEATKKRPVTAADLEWRVERVRLPLAGHLVRDELQKTLADAQADPRNRLNAATKLAYLGRAEAGQPIELSCLRLGKVHVLHMCGELFVEYQLAAQKMRPGETVCMAAYGDYGPGYIGTAVAYTQGGYEVQPRSSNTAPEVEAVLMGAMKKLLAVE